MEKTVQDVIEEKKEIILKKEVEIKEKEKQELLQKNGLFRKEYAKDAEASKEEYPFVDCSGDTTRYYKKVNLPIKDEDYKKLQELDQQIKGINSEVNGFNSKNAVSTPEGSSWYEIILNIIAVLVFIGGVIAGCAQMYMGYPGYGLLIFLGTFVSGFLFLVLAKIISMLYSIKKDTAK